MKLTDEHIVDALDNGLSVERRDVMIAIKIDLDTRELHYDTHKSPSYAPTTGDLLADDWQVCE
jgi:hypothetical protein